LSFAWLEDEKAEERCRAARQKFLVDKIDVTDYVVKTIEQVSDRFSKKQQY
jgi:hypothetical protein